jgi:hypothetical protein
MIPTRAVLTLPALLLVLTGCGAVSAITLRTTTNSVAGPDAAPHGVRLNGTPAPAVPTPSPTSPAVSASPPPVTHIIATVPIAAGKEWLEILTTSGSVIARTEIDPTLAWMIGAGPGGAYWAENGIEHELTTSGAVRALGSVPSDATGVVISPDGTSFAYATAAPAPSGSITNRIVVVRPGRAPAIVADRVSDPNHPTADAPASWSYYLIGWNGSGIAFARVPSGGCGCAPFDMQMQSAYSASIDPATLRVTTLTADSSCPLSSVGPGLETVCFASGSTGTSAIHIASGGTLIHSYRLSAANVAGDAVFAPSGKALAYVTIPTSQNTCSTTLTPTLRLLNVATGAAVARNVGDFTPLVWAPAGPIYGQMATGSATWLAAVNPATLAVTRLTADSQGAALVGIM